MSCCHQHQQQSYHDENTKICMFTTLYVRYVDILFPLTKSIPIMFEHVTKLYKHGWAMMQRVTITSTRYGTRYHTFYHTFSPSLTWLGYNAMYYHNCNVLPYIFSNFSMVWGYLQRVATCYCQIYKTIYINI